MTVIIILTALIATFVGSISGIGGGVLIKPVMDAIFDATSSQIREQRETAPRDVYIQ